MVIRNKCYNTCFYLHDRFRIRKLFLVRHDTLHGRSLSIYGSECQIWKTFTTMFTTNISAGKQRKKMESEKEKCGNCGKTFALKGKSYDRKSFNANLKLKIIDKAIKRFVYEFTSMFIIWLSIQIRIYPKRGKCT